MKNIILLILCALLTQCVFLEKDDVLPKAVPFTGNQLKINGYYYQIILNNKSHSPLIMYGNGVLLKMGDFTTDSIEEMDEYIIKDYVNDNWYKRNKYLWGVFFVYDNIVIYNRLTQDYPHRENIREGIILNDTTIQIIKYSSANYVTFQNEIYHFREFSPKPDSTNVYIK